jgi:predicted ester cyclase
MASQKSNSQRRDDLIRVGEEGINTGDESVLDPYFADDYIFHGPDGDMNFTQLKAFWSVWRSAFSGFRIRREQIIVEGNFIGARNTFSGVFDKEMTESPMGPIQPNGKPVHIEVINTFRYDDDGRLAEEWVQYDNVGYLKQLGVEVLKH